MKSKSKAWLAGIEDVLHDIQEYRCEWQEGALRERDKGNGFREWHGER
jgi:hypothetical protein